MKSRERIFIHLKTRAVWEPMELLGRSQNWLTRQVEMIPGYLSTLLNQERAPSGRIRLRMQRVPGLHDFHELFKLRQDYDGA